MSFRLRQHQVQHYWPYLPAFRVVAEVRNVTAAAELMFVTPSAISKTLRRLEELFGHALFDREGGKLELTGAGERLLAATRTALRAVDDAWTALDPAPPELRIAVEEPLLFVVGCALGKTQPFVNFSIISSAPNADAGALLLRGEVDLIIQRTPTSSLAQGLAEARLGVHLLEGSINSVPLAANIGLALAGRKASLPLALATKLGFKPTTLESIPVSAVTRVAAAQGQALMGEIAGVIAALKSELSLSHPEE